VARATADDHAVSARFLELSVRGDAAFVKHRRPTIVHVWYDIGYYSRCRAVR
jgi:hypothetical protein